MGLGNNRGTLGETSRAEAALHEVICPPPKSGATPGITGQGDSRHPGGEADEGQKI
jgi:hypothetical protein